MSGQNSGVGMMSESNYDQRSPYSDFVLPRYHRGAMYQTQTLHCIAGKLILCKLTEGFGKYVLNFLFVSVIQYVILFSAFDCSLSSKEEI